MKKFIPLLFLFLSSGLAFGQSDEFKWAVFSEIAPYANATPAMHENNFYSHNISWRNRVGILAGENTIIGLLGSYRSYEYLENKTFVNEIDPTNPRGIGVGYDYRFQTQNNLLGAGVFATQLIPLGKKLELQLNYYAMVEQGKGEVNRINESIYGIGISIFIIDLLPPVNYEYRERNLNTGFDIGLSYYLRNNLALQGNLRLVQLENFNFRSNGAQMFPETEDHNLNLNQNGSRFNYLINMPVAHFGISYHLGSR
ncbi:hypothetical protein KI659_14790 [Litoribacter alkaliphilus]|uniref:Outer membrane beta-barrel protein n=1 Tax=Litoribacter ruber TaxID=702568 RepID=A0AAP2CIC1_9BACT|nr:hypothetical protein [Litoribacter alkaliphilus]MBS9525283.1 hypothetical protein [Litoribacter alkaliphilus]